MTNKETYLEYQIEKIQNIIKMFDELLQERLNENLLFKIEDSKRDFELQLKLLEDFNQ